MRLRAIYIKESNYLGPLRGLERTALYNRLLLDNNRPAGNLLRLGKQRLSGLLPLGSKGRGNRLRLTTIAARRLELENDVQKGGGSRGGLATPEYKTNRSRASGT